MAIEIWDAYDREENLLGIDLIRGENIPKGMYHLVSSVLVRHSDGDYLVMKRAENKESWPGRYEATAGGSALKGENALECARRELKEETGIIPESIRQIYRNVTEHTIFYGYLCDTSCNKESILLQPGETVNYCWLCGEEFYRKISTQEFIPTQYDRLRPFLEMVKEDITFLE